MVTIWYSDYGKYANSCVLGFRAIIPNTSSGNIFRGNFDARIWGNHFQHLLGKHRITPSTSSENILRCVFDARIWGNYFHTLLGKHRSTPYTSSEKEH